MSSVRRSGWRRFSCEPFEVCEPDLDERPDRLLEPGLPRDCERLFVALPNLVGLHSLLQAVVAGQEQVVDLLACRRLVDAGYLRGTWLQVTGCVS
jgi:hypothetical protein